MQRYICDVVFSHTAKSRGAILVELTKDFDNECARDNGGWWGAYPTSQYVKDALGNMKGKDSIKLFCNDKGLSDNAEMKQR